MIKIEGKQLSISDSIKGVDSIENFIKPYTKHINNTLDAPLAYSKYTLSKDEGELNTALGNFMADAVYELIAPIFNQRTDTSLDFVLLNHGGIRSAISLGNISTRTAYEIMPFENAVVVVELTAEKVKEMIGYLIQAKKAHPISGIKIILNKDYSLKDVTIQGKPINNDKTYRVATSDYLANLGDNMNFFANPIHTTETDYLLRALLIDYFKKADTIAPIVDDRFVRLP